MAKNNSNLREIIRNLRKSYEFKKLFEEEVSKDPFIQFQNWMEEAVKSGVKEPNVMTLATVGKNGFPNARIVLLRDLDKDGFSFFTNYKSDKGAELSKKKACLNFFWMEVARQVKITGFAEKVPSRESKAYFKLRPRESQLGAWASEQSQVIPDRAYLEGRFHYYEDKFKGKEVPCPPHWGGYRIKPVEIEFWQGRESRLHDRIRYTKTKKGWKMERLAP